jgi:hypothetical protein
MGQQYTLHAPSWHLLQGVLRANMPCCSTAGELGTQPGGSRRRSWQAGGEDMTEPLLY